MKAEGGWHRSVTGVVRRTFEAAVEDNIPFLVMMDLVRETDSSDTVVPRLAQAGVLVVPFGPRRLRAVTHLDVTRRDVERAADIIAEVLR